MAKPVIGDAIPTDITDEYDVGKTLGTGHFSKVKLGTNKKTGEKVAIKIIVKPTGAKIAMLKAEVDILTKCNHANIVKMYKCYETEKILYLVLELLTGGELFDTIIAKGHYSEADARGVTTTLLEAIAYLHSQGVAHRDLKPENILLSDKTDSAIIKVTDFGLSKVYSDSLAGEVVMKTACGTPGYVAPEVLGHEAYSQAVDLWSIGVIVYILLCGFPPFYGDNDAQMFKRIKAGQFKFLSPYWDPISKDAKDFVKELLVVDPNKRMTAMEALNHKWLGRTSAATAKNLFTTEAPTSPTAVTSPSSAVKSALSSPSSAQPAAEKAAPAPEDSGDGGPEAESLRTKMMQFNLDRKVDQPLKLIKLFGLPQGERRYGKFKCAYGSVKNLGQLHVTTNHVCFIGGFGGKKECISLESVTSLAKAKLFTITPGNGHSIHIMTEKKTHEFHYISEREVCLKVIMAQCAAGGKTPTVIDKTK